MSEIIDAIKGPKKSHRLIYLLFAFTLAIFYDIFLWNNQIGLGFTLFVFLYIIGFIVINNITGQLKNKWAYLFLIPITIMSIDIVIFNNDLVKIGVPIFVIVLLFFFSICSTLKNPFKHKFSISKIPLIGNILLVFSKWGDIVRDIVSPARKNNKELISKIISGVLLSIPILFLFGLLFTSADAVFSNWMQELFTLEDESGLYIWRIIRTILLFLLFGGFFYVIIDEKHTLKEKIIRAIKIDRTITTIILTLINLLFLTFVFIQINYLFGNMNFVLDREIIFAEYARSGFFQLVWVILLAGAMISFIYRSFSHHGSSKSIDFLQFLFIIQVTVIALSALKRMNLYQEAYGYTVLRLYVEWFIYLIMAILAFAAVSIFKSIEFRKYFYGCIILSLTALTIVSSVNIDYLIAKKNIGRELIGKNKVNLDLDYILDLSIDTYPALLKLENYQFKDWEKKMWNNKMEKMKYRYMHRFQEDMSIFEYNYNREKVKKLLPQIIEKVEA